MTLRLAVIGAGRRASQGHYPAIARLEGVELVAVCDLDETRLRRVTDEYGVGRHYTDYRRMLDEADPEAVCVIMAPRYHVPIALECLARGKHVLVEKPPAMSATQLGEMADAAEKNGCRTAVCFQRRQAPVAREVRRRVLERGPVTLCIGEFHKNLLGRPGPDLGFSTLHDDVIHAVDFVRYQCGGEAVEVHAFQDRFFADWKNCYNALIRFSSGAVGIVSGNRSSGGRLLRFEMHGRAIAGYIDMPDRADVYADNAREPETMTGRDLVGGDDRHAWEGTLHVYRDFAEAIRTGREALASFRDCVGTMKLVEAMEG